MAEPLPAPPPLSGGAALFLDFDGTLVELAEAPDAIRVPGELEALLARLVERLGGRLAIVTGRSLADLDRHVRCAGAAFSGSHGLELRLGDGRVVPRERPEGLESVQAEVTAFAAGREGLLAEPKPGGVALHYRRAPEREAEALALVEDIGRRTGLEVQLGKMVAELRASGCDKGVAVERLMREPPFVGARPLFVGDDLTDERGFEAAAGLGGGGILVGPARETAALWRLEDVAAVARWLGAAAA
jgi:trehalose 6-phosphate phosphatase